MTRLLQVAIVGRPNVGKSSLFNAIAKKRIAIVDEEEGVTRDRLTAAVDRFGCPFQIIDTGGVDSAAPFGSEIIAQVEYAIEAADAIIMVVDGSCQPHDLDRTVAKLLHKAHKPLVLAINKADRPIDTLHAYASLGIQPMIEISALHSTNLAELLELLPLTAAPPPPPDAMPAIALVGRPNVGKSTLLNALLGEERAIVSPLPGTTRDAFDTPCEVNGRPYLLIDTAGIRRRHKTTTPVDKYAHRRTLDAIERADVCLLLLDAQQGITTEEKRIASAIAEAHKACIVLLNKWDLLHGVRMEHCLKALTIEVPFIATCPILFISASTHRNVAKIFPTIDRVLAAYEQRVTTPQLNKAIVAALQKYHPPAINGKRLRIYYGTQISAKPPHFVLFANIPALMDKTYKQYLTNSLREAFGGLPGSPILITLRGKPRRAVPTKE